MSRTGQSGIEARGPARTLSVGPVNAVLATGAAIVLVIVAQLFLQRARAGLIREWSARLAVGATAAATRLAGWRQQQLDEIQTLAQLTTGHTIRIGDDLRIVPHHDSTGVVGRGRTLRFEPIDSSSGLAVATAPLPTNQVLERRLKLGSEFRRSLPRPPIDPTGRPYRTAIAEAAFRSGGISADAMRHFNERIAATMDLRPLLARITAPTLVIAGEIDPFGGPTCDEIAAALPNPTVVTIPGADHFPFLEPDHRAPWSRAILDFLAG